MKDLIDRQAAIDAINALHDMPNAWLDSAVDAVMALPSAQSERPRGEWIPHKSIFGGLGEKVYTCNKCGYNIGFYTENYCPRCGAYVRGKHDE